MDSKKYIGMDVHKESISIAVMNSAGKLVMESVIETKASTILQFIHGLSGDLQVTFEEGTCGAAGSVGRKQEAQGVETAPSDTRNRPDPWGAVDGVDPNAPPVSNQATAVDLQWSGIRNA
jgi:hypothetical protein